MITIALLMGMVLAPGTTMSQGKMWMSAYYPTYATGDLPASEIQWQGITHLIHIGESSNPDTSGNRSPWYAPLINKKDSLDLLLGGGQVTPNNSQHVADSLSKYARRYGVKLLLSVGGGWGAPAAAMSWIAADSTRIQIFVNATTSFARRHGYDGIEVDWEQFQTRDAMSRLTRLFRIALDTWTPRGIMVFAVGDADLPMYDMRLSSYVDQYNIMMYDYWTNQAPEVTAFNAPLYPPDKNKYPHLYQWQKNYQGVLNGINNPTWSGPRLWIQKGWPPGKLGMGIPLYGYTYVGKSAPNEPNAQRESYPRFTAYRTSLKAMESGGKYYWEDGACVPWIGGVASAKFGEPYHFEVLPGQRFYITFENIASVRLKVEWAKGLRLGGVMAYDLWFGYLSSAPEQGRHPLLKAVIKAIGD